MMTAKKILTIFMVLGMINNSFSQETIDLFIWTGQSNALGYSGDAAFYPADPNGLDSQIRFNWTYIDNSSSSDWETMQAQDGLFPLGHFGPEVTFSRELKKAGYNPAIFKFTKGDTSIYKNWKTPGKGGFYDDMITKLITAIAQLENLGHTVNIGGFIWIQGESDANNLVNANAYQTNLSSIINDLRNNVINNSKLPVILGVDEQFPYIVNQPAVLNAHQDIAEKDSSICFTSMYGLPKADATHLTPAGLETHGKQIFDTFSLLISGQTTPSFCATTSIGNTLSTLEKSSWGQTFKSSCTGYLSEINFNSATDLSSSLTLSISNGADCNATLLHSQTINSLVDGTNSVIISEELLLNKEHTYYINITSDSGENWNVRHSDSNQVIGSLRTYLDGEANSTCGWNFPDLDLNFSAIITGVSLSTNNESKRLDKIYIYPNPSEENVNIYLNNLENVSVKVITGSGQTIYTKKNINSLVHTIKLKNTSAGIYFVQVNYRGRKREYKLIRK
jgi:hypothetical protein